MTYHFPKKILGSRISLTYKKLMKILGKSYEVSKIGPQNNNRCLSLHMHAGVQSVRMLSPCTSSPLYLLPYPGLLAPTGCRPVFGTARRRSHFRPIESPVNPFWRNDKSETLYKNDKCLKL